MAGIKFDITGDNKNVLNAFNGVQRGVRQTQSVIERSGQSIESLFNRIQAAMSAGLMGFSAVGLGKQIMAIRGEFQQLEVAFTTMLGSEKKANALMEQLVNTAAKTPFDLKSVAAGAKSLMAYGTAAEDVNEMLTRLGDIAAGMSIPLNDLVYLYGTTMTQGRMFTQDLRQFQGRGIPIADEIAKIMGVTKQAVGDLVTAGKVTSDVFHQAILNMTNEGSKFGGLMDAQSKTITGQISNIEDAIDMMFNDIGKQSEGFINEGLGAVSYLIEHYKEIGEAVLTAATAFGAYKAALMITVAATNSYQKLNFGKQMEALNAEIEALIPAQQASANADLEQAVAKGELTAAQAEEIANRRELLAQMQQGTTASGMTDDLDAQISQARELLGIKEESVNVDLDAMVAKGQINEAQAKEIADKRSLLEKLSEEVEKRREAAQEALDAAFDEKEAAQQNFEMMSDYADAAEEAYANALDMGDAEEIEAAREKMLTAVEAQNTAEKRLNAATTQVQAAQKEVNSLATTANTAAETANTAAETTNTAATNTNTLSQKMHAISAKAGALAQSILTFAINGTTAALNMMKTAIMTNPIGVLIGAVTIAWPLISKLTSKTDDATAAQKRYNDSTTEATANVKALYATLGTANKTSKVAADTAKELKQVADEYGVKLSEEATKIGNETKLVEELTAKREELIDAIRREAIERERANQMEEVGDVYAKSIEEARKELKESLGVDDILASAMANSITDEQIQKLAELKRTMEEVRLKEGEMSQAAVHASEEYMSAYQKVLFQLQNQAMEYAELSGKTEEYEGKLLNIREALAQFINSTNESNTQLQNSKIAISNATLAQTEAINVMDAAKISASNLNTITQALINKWNAGYSLDLQINVDTSKVPAWITNMTDEELKSGIAERQNELRNTNFLSKWFGTARSDLYTLGVMQSEANKREAKKPKIKPTALTPTPKKTGKTGSKGKVWNEEHARQDREKIQKEYTESIKEMLEDITQEISDAEIEYEDESTQKGLKKLDEDEKKRLKAIKERREKLIEDRRKLALELHTHTKGGDKYNFKDLGDDEYLRLLEEEQPELLAALKKQEEQITKAISKERTKIIKEETDAQRAALNDFLREYGTYEQKRLAITEDTEKRIAEAKTIGEKLSIQAQGRKALMELDKAQADKQMDWEGIFGNLTNYTAAQLEEFKNALRAKLSEQGTTIEEYKTIVKQIGDINDAILTAQSEEKSFLGMYLRTGGERKRLTTEREDAEREWTQARGNTSAAVINQRMASARLATALKNVGYTGSLDPKDVEKWMSENRSKLNDHQISTVNDSLLRLGKSTEEVTQAQEKEEEAMRRLTRAETQLQGFLGNFARKLADLMPMFEQIADNIGALPDLAASLGFDENSAIGKSAQGMVDLANSTMGAFSDFSSGNYVGAAAKAISALGSLGDVMGTIGIAGFGMSDRTLITDIEKLTASNEALMTAVNSLTEKMQDSSITESMDIYKQIVDDISKTMANTQEMMTRSAAAYNGGFAGVGGKGSSNKKINRGVSASEWSLISSITGETVSGAADFFRLTSKQMYEVAERAPEIYAKIKRLADDGQADAAQFMDEYISQWKQLEEAEENYAQKLTSTTFDNVYDSFISSLSDMDKSAYEFSQDFEQYMFNAVLNAKMGELFHGELEKWYQDFKNAMESGGMLTPDEIENLREQWTDISKRAVEERDELQRLTGYGDSTEGSATYNAAKSFTQEQGDILNGRLTAIQINTATGNALRQQIIASLESLRSIAGCSTETNTAVVEIRNMMIYTNSYLEDMVRYAKATYNDFGEKLENIRYNLETKL